MANDIDSLIASCSTILAKQMQDSGKLLVIESYARVLNQLLEAKHREVGIEDNQRMIVAKYANQAKGQKPNMILPSPNQ